MLSNIIDYKRHFISYSLKQISKIRKELKKDNISDEEILCLKSMRSYHIKI